MITCTAKVDETDENEQLENFIRMLPILKKRFEGRIGLDHEIGNLKGVLGMQGLIDLYKIVGEESIFAGASGSLVDLQGIKFRRIHQNGSLSGRGVQFDG